LLERGRRDLKGMAEAIDLFAVVPGKWGIA